MLELILTLLLGKEKSEKLSPILTTFKENGYDLKSTLKNLDVSTLMPLITSFTEVFSPNAQSQPTTAPYTETPNNFYSTSATQGYDNGNIFTDLKEIAGQEITDLLENYFE